MMTAKTDFEKQSDEGIRAALAPRLAAVKSRHEKTREAATLLFFGHGIYPSAKTVHSYTQHGSLTDINGDLREFWSDLREKTRVKLDAPMLPDELVSQFSEALAKVWSLAGEKANAVLDGERQEMHAKVLIAQQESTEAQRMCRVADERTQAIELELRQERERRELAEKRVEALAADVIGLQSSLAKWQEQAESEAKARKDSEERYLRDLESERSTRLHEAESLNSEIRFAKMQIESARSVERELRDQFVSIRSGLEIELASYRQKSSKAEDALATARLEMAELKGRYEGLALRNNELQDRIKGMAKLGVRGVAKSGGSLRALKR